MKVFLTGATGFLGSHLAEALVQRGDEVWALKRSSSSLTHLKELPIQWIQGDLSGAWEGNPLDGMDAVIHVAGAIKALSAREFNRVNAEGTSRLADLALSASSKPKVFIHVSTIAVHNPSLDGLDFCLPADRCHPLTQYGRSKLAGEKSLQRLAGKIPYRILRPPVLYGPRDRELLPFFKAIQRGVMPLLGDGSRAFSMCYVGDVVQAILNVLEREFRTVATFCMDDGEVHTWKSLGMKISEILDKKPLVLPIPLAFFRLSAFLTENWARLSRKAHILTLDKIREMKQANWVCGHQKLTEATGWKAKINAAQGLRLTLEFYRKEGWLA